MSTMPDAVVTSTEDARATYWPVAPDATDSNGLSQAVYRSWLAQDLWTGPTRLPTAQLDLSVTFAGKEDEKDKWSALELAAEVGNERSFLAGLALFDWTAQSSRDFVYAVRLALAAGAHKAARRLAQEGHRLHPAQRELAKMAAILAPPRAVPAQSRPAGQMAANQRWLRLHRTTHQGKWVALRDGQLVAAAESARELRAAVPDLDGLMVTIV